MIKTASWFRAVSNSAEFQRILGLPRRRLEHDPYLAAAMNELFRLPGSSAELRPIQVQALAEMAEHGGLIGAIGVGWGKTPISLLAPTALDSECAVLLVPASLRGKTLRDRAKYAKWWKLPPVHIHTYEELSSKKSAGLLEDLRPDLVILDEAHKVKRTQSARTKRLRLYLRRNPGCRLVALSGMFSQQSITEYSYFCARVLGDRSPLPRSYHELMDWAGALDADPEEPRMPGALRKLCAPGESPRDGYRRRFAETPGVIATVDTGWTGNLILREIRIPLPPAVKKARESLRKEWKIGDLVITEATRFAATMKQIGLGFWYRWDWPNGVPDEEWLDARRAWHRELRYFLRARSRPGADSQSLVEEQLDAGRITGHEINVAWQAWRAAKDRPEPPTVPVWIDDFVLRRAEKWAKENKRGIVWYQHRAYGEEFQRRGWAVYGHGDDAERATEPVIACSIRAQNTGKNLQDRWNKNLILSMPSGAEALEQLIGRTHRHGQKEDEVIVDWLAHTDEMHRALERAEKQALFVQETTGQRQKILLAEKV